MINKETKQFKALEQRVQTLEADNLLVKQQLKEIMEAMEDAQK